MEHGALAVHRLAYTGTAALLRIQFEMSLMAMPGTTAVSTAWNPEMWGTNVRSFLPLRYLAPELSMQQYYLARHRLD